MVRPGRTSNNPYSSAAAVEASVGGELHDDLAAANFKHLAVVTDPGAASLPLTTDTIVSTIHARLLNAQPFTRVGGRCLIALHPRSSGSVTVNMEAISKAHAAKSRDTNPEKWKPQQRNSASGEVDIPDVSVFDISSSAYWHLVRGMEDQAIILLGESGSGKSESHRQITRSLCDLSKTTKKKTKVHSAVLKTEAVFSAFGNAHTPQNRNASRFIRYTEYQFDAKGRMAGAKFIDYLLEKARVTAGGIEDDSGLNGLSSRNFNIFYYLLAGATAEEKQQLQLGDTAHYHYLSVSSTVMHADDAQAMADLRENLKTVGIGRRQQAQLLQVVAAILHLGNVNFIDDSNSTGEPCSVKNYTQMALVADLLGLHPSALETALTYKTQVLKKDTVSVFLDAKAAAEQRDSFARSLYAVVFSYVVEQVNNKLCKSESEWANFIAVLDVPGFYSGSLPSSAATGSPSSSPASRRGSVIGSGDKGLTDSSQVGFQRLLINFASDRLAAFTSQQLFDLPRDVLVAEQLPAPTVADFTPASLALLEGSDTLPGILPTLDAEAARGTKDSKATERLHSIFTSSPAYVAPSARKPKYAFAVRHAGGVVEYDTRGFADRNTDVLLSDFVTLVRGSPEQSGTSSAFVRSLFSDRMIATLGGDGVSGTVTVPSLKRRKKGEAEETVDVGGTIGHRFRASVSDILETLGDTQTWFILNIKPTDEPAPMTAAALGSSSGVAKFDAVAVKRQVEALNVVAIAANPAILYTAAFRHADFLSRFATILAPMRLPGDAKTQCETFMRGSKWTPLQARVGKTRVFIAEREWRMIEDQLRAREEEELARTRGLNDTASDYRVGGGYAASSDAGSNYRYRPRNGQDKGGDDDENFSDDGSQFGSEFGGSVFGGSVAGGRSMPPPLLTKSSLGDSVIDVGAAPSTAPLDPQNLGEVKGGKGDFGESALDRKKSKKDSGPKKPKKKMTRARCQWLFCTWLSTWWVPWFCLTMCGMKRYERQIAWREKVALCIIILLMNAFILFFIVGIGLILCPPKKVLSAGEISTHVSLSSSSSILGGNTQALVYMYGSYYAASDFYYSHFQDHGAKESEWVGSGLILGRDVSSMFDKSQYISKASEFIGRPYCNSVSVPSSFALFSPSTLTGNLFYPHGLFPPASAQYDHLTRMTGYRRGTVVWDRDSIAGLLNPSVGRKILVAYDRVYDVSSYFPPIAPVKQTFLGDFANLILDQNANTGTDSTVQWESVKVQNPRQWAAALSCLNDMFYIGDVDHRNDLKCVVTNYILLAASCVLVFIIGFKFIAALQFGTKKQPEDHDKFIICQVPCYTEGETSMLETLRSLANLDYDDKHKLIFVIADGMIIGSGNDRPTPRIVLDILGVDPSVDPESLSFQSLGEGGKQHNMAKVYSGLYEYEGHVVPYIVVVKVGTPNERNRPGNRGKRDSQLILMRFLSRVHFNQPMTPLELGLYHNMKNIIGVEPSYYEYIFSIDADTHVYPDSLNRLVSNMVKDSKIIGICGETELSNDKKSWVTMIQVYEYFISHHLSKAFESLFGSVTCLPGCFSMYRVRTPVKAIPLIIAPGLVEDYSENDVSTLHLKNLLHLGEDRYLTTLLMKHFPAMKTAFTGDAKCKTNAPDKFKVLLSQRRRWINSTVHNLFELLFLPELCGFCCFDMRFVVFVDLFATFVQPAALLYIAYLVYAFATNPATSFPLISLIMIAAIYGFQVVIFIVKQEWAHIGWMIIYILGIPFFAFFIPIYSFWNFDDFSWGNTRVVIEGASQKEVEGEAAEVFDPSTIPLKLWSDYEYERQDRLERQSVASYHSKSGLGGGTRSVTGVNVVPGSYAGSLYGGIPVGAPASVYGGTIGVPPAPGSIYAGSAYGGAVPTYQPPMTTAGSIYGGGGAGIVNGGEMYSNSPPAGYANNPNRMSWAAQSATSSSTRSVPTDEEILSQVRAVLSTADLMSVTRKSVREELARVFGVDLSSRKDFIHACIDGVLRGDL